MISLNLKSWQHQLGELKNFFKKMSQRPQYFDTFYFRLILFFWQDMLQDYNNLDNHFQQSNRVPMRQTYQQDHNQLRQALTLIHKVIKIRPLILPSCDSTSTFHVKSFSFKHFLLWKKVEQLWLKPIRMVLESLRCKNNLRTTFSKHNLVTFNLVEWLYQN